MTLTTKQELFIASYLENFNATEAATKAGYRGSNATLRSVGSENLTKPNIKAAIAQEIATLTMGKNEALSRLAIIARGPGDFLTAEPYVDADGNEHVNVVVGYTALLKAGLGGLIKSVTPTRYGSRVEFYDAQRALETILKALGAFENDACPPNEPVKLVVQFESGCIL